MQDSIRRTSPYFLPMTITLIFVSCVYAGIFWPGPFLLPVVAFLLRFGGKFSPGEAVAAYRFFHHNKLMNTVKTINGCFFVLFNVWVFYFLSQKDLPVVSLTIFIYTIIILNSNFAIALAHDLMHAVSLHDRILGMLLLLGNGFFYLESDHIYIHHRYVGTAKDPASAFSKENLYQYIWRSVPRRLMMIFGIDLVFPKEKRWAIVSGNIVRMLICLAYLAIAFMAGRQVFLCIAMQFVFVTLLYEVITYIQHYGLRRKLIDDREESVKLNHSWNCYYKVSAYLHFMMPVHSIHHLRNEPELSTLSDAGPAYPRPFGQMALIALIPPVWFRLMEKRLDALNAKET